MAEQGMEPFVIAAGASAGGLEALVTTLKSCPIDSGLCIIVVQHLSPDHQSMLPELLSRHVDMRVQHPVDGEVPLADTVYVIPPRHQLIFKDERIHVTTLERTPGRISLPIDTLFCSLALERKDRCALVVLSGTGSDGSEGIRIGKQAGAITIAQTPESARFDGMPRAAIGTGFVDLVLGPREVIPELMAMQERGSSSYFSIGSEHLELIVPRVLLSVKAHTGVDFIHYKPATIIRRIQRRMRQLEIDDVREYADRVRTQASEAHQLRRELLIGVTRFLRDEGAIRALQRIAIPKMVENAGGPLRIWVSGCSTGEEAYSLAILLQEALETSQDPSRKFKVFATDVDDAAVEQASLGEYSAESLRQLPEAMRERYFSRRGEHYVVSKPLREHLLFSRHDLLQDPPFSRIDMVSCRNLLIYFKPVAQERALRLLANSLRDDGILWLGASESIGDRSELFEPLDSRWKIFQSRPGRKRSPIAPLRSHTGPDTSRLRQADRLKIVLEQIQTDYVPPCLVVDDSLRLLYRFGRLDRLIRMPQGAFSMDARDFLPDSLSGLLTSVIARTQDDSDDVYCREVSVELDEGPIRFDLRVRRLRVEGAGSMLAMFFEGLHRDDDRPRLGVDIIAADQSTQDRVKTLEQELRLSRESLQATIEELESSNEESQATNEELIAANEELQSTNEELQSVNEELHTVNIQHGERLDELGRLNDDLDNLFSSVDMAILFLDSSLAIRRFNGAVEQYFNLLPHDGGRPLAHLSHRLDYPDLLDDCARVLRTGEPSLRRTRAGDEVVMARITPHMSDLHGVQGVVITLADITMVENAERTLEQLTSAFRNSSASICMLDERGKILHANSTFLSASGYEQQDLMRRDWTELLPEIERDRARELLARVRGGHAFRGVVQLRSRTGTCYFELTRLSRASQRDSTVVYLGEALHTNMRSYHASRSHSDSPALGRSSYSLWTADPRLQIIDPGLAELLGSEVSSGLDFGPRAIPNASELQTLFAEKSREKARLGYMFEAGKPGDARRLLARLEPVTRSSDPTTSRWLLLEVSELPLGPSGWRVNPLDG